MQYRTYGNCSVGASLWSDTYTNDDIVEGPRMVKPGIEMWVYRSLQFVFTEYIWIGHVKQEAERV